MLHFAACALGTFLGLHLNILVLIPLTVIGAALLGAFAAQSGQSPPDGLVMVVPMSSYAKPPICSD